jgi:small subunit ribosomal protein S21
VRQSEERGAAPDRLALAVDQLEPPDDRVRDPVAEAQAEEIGAREVRGQRRVALGVEGERQVDAAAREGEPGEARVDAGLLNGAGERPVGPAVERNMRQRRGDDRAAGGGEMVVLAAAIFAHGIATPRIFIEASDGQPGLVPLYSAFLPFIETQRHAKGGESTVQVMVRDNNVDQALRALKKKLQREGVFREMKLRQHFEKPSVKKARERAEAIRRARKLARKKMQREGLA